MLIPTDRLSPDTLLALIDEFVSRDGTDYGEREISLEARAAQVRRQLDKGDIVIVFDAESESCNIITREAWQETISRATPGFGRA